MNSKTSTLLVTLIGGINSFIGPLLGSAVFIILREIIERFTENWMLWFGIILLVIIMGFRGGIMGVIHGLFSSAGPYSKKEN